MMMGQLGLNCRDAVLSKIKANKSFESLVEPQNALVYCSVGLFPYFVA